VTETAAPPEAPEASQLGIVGQWTWSSQTGIPSAKQIRTDTGNWVSATSVNVTAVDNSNNDHSDDIRMLDKNDTVIITSAADDTIWARFTVQAPAVDNSTWFAIPVVVQSQSGVAPTNNTTVTAEAQLAVAIGNVNKIEITLSPGTVAVSPDMAENLVNLIAAGFQTVAHLVSQADFEVYVQGGDSIVYSFDIHPAIIGEPFP